jgi:glycosyltransferase involved in cell wall biosynthesis/spore maturation protein CgeB
MGVSHTELKHIAVDVLARPRLAVIADDFTSRSLAPDFDLVELTPEGWNRELATFEPDLLFVESAWRGKDRLWERQVAPPGEPLQELVRWCRGHGIPTAFWNKEDPVHFHTFLNTASLFDFVFTTDFDMLPRYREVLGHDRVFLFPFAVQPRLFNPLDADCRVDAVCFAGAYYARYAERARDFDSLVSGILTLKPVVVYDRNHGQKDTRYQFPHKYGPLIVGSLPYDGIHRAYKGFKFGLNLNSVKHSQTMFARRVVELLASGTVVLSNYARSLRVLFGDLVLASDDGKEMARKLGAMNDADKWRWFSSMGVRRAVGGHTFADRMAYVWATVNRERMPKWAPTITLLATATDREDLERVVAAALRQTHPNWKLRVSCADGAADGFGGRDERVRIVSHLDDSPEVDSPYVGVLVSDDWYGPGYLSSLLAGFRFGDFQGVGKGAAGGPEYRRVGRVALRSGLFKREALLREYGCWEAVVDAARSGTVQLDGALVDAWDYRREVPDEFRDPSTGWQGELDAGLPIEDLLARASRKLPEEKPGGRYRGRRLHASSIGTMIQPKNQAVRVRNVGSALEVESGLSHGKHTYLYASEAVEPHAFGFDDGGKGTFYVETTPGVDVRLAFRAMDAEGRRTGGVVIDPNINQEVQLPPGTRRILPGVRVAGPGMGRIIDVDIGGRDLVLPEMIVEGDILVVTNHYPTYDNLYRNGFVHRRVVGYRREGMRVQVAKIASGRALAYGEFQGVDWLEGSPEVLDRILSSGTYRAVFVHFLDRATWDVLRKYRGDTPIVIWLHGVDVQPWYRRTFHAVSEEERARLDREWERKREFWREVFRSADGSSIRFVFVSRYLYDGVTKDVGIKLPTETYTVIPNPIDTEIFRYEPRSPDHRLRILMVRPFASAVYANDLAVKAIMSLRDTQWFGDASFRIIGDGPLFDDTVAPLVGLPNVSIERRFMRQEELASLYLEYGIFLCPTRMDSQGVSRDEAMATGLVPVTNAVAAVPEFVDETCGILAPPEDHEGLAKGITTLVEDPSLFLEMSRAAADRVRQQSDSARVIEAELGFAGFANGTLAAV